jgi:hypothetical protein
MQAPGPVPQLVRRFRLTRRRLVPTKRLTPSQPLRYGARPLTGRSPSGKAEACKASIRRFESDPPLFPTTRCKVGVLHGCSRRFCLMLLRKLTGTVAVVIVLAGSVATSPAFAQSVADSSPADVSAADSASFLGGSLDAVPAGITCSGSNYRRYRQTMDRAWSRYDSERAAPMQQWVAEHVSLEGYSTAFYPFSGPDFVSVHRFFPFADRYVMVALQIAGRPPDLTSSTARCNLVLETFARGAIGFGQLGFFVTEQLYEEFQDGDAVEGITGMLMLMADRSGFAVDNVTPIRIDHQGQISIVDPATSTASDWASVRLQMTRRADGASVTLDYVRLNLSDAWLNDHDHHAQFIREAASQPVVFKAASHMPQLGWFELLNQAVASTSPLVIQDETGVPLELLQQHMSVEIFGEYTGPNDLFPETPHQSLIDAFASGEPGILPFSWGYDKAAGSCLVLATRP